MHPARVLQLISITLKEAQTTSDILMSAEPVPNLHKSGEQNAAICFGSAAEYMTGSEIMSAHKELIKAKALEKLRRE